MRPIDELERPASPVVGNPELRVSKRRKWNRPIEAFFNADFTAECSTFAMPTSAPVATCAGGQLQ